MSILLSLSNECPRDAVRNEVRCHHNARSANLPGCRADGNHSLDFHPRLRARRSHRRRRRVRRGRGERPDQCPLWPTLWIQVEHLPSPRSARTGHEPVARRADSLGFPLLKICGSPSHSALPRDVDWQVLDARLLNRLWVELRQRQYFLRHTHFDGEPQLAGFSCSKRVVMRPMSTRKLILEGFRSRLVHSRRQKLYSTSFNLRESLLSHIGENQREVEDISDGLRVAVFDDARSRKSNDLRIDR